MQHSLNQIFLIGSLALTAIHCDTDPVIEDTSPQMTEEGLSLLDSVSGRWLMTGTAFDTCPPEASIAFPLGETIWADVDGQLWLEESKGGLSATLMLIPTDEETFIRTAEASWNECDSTQSITLQITGRNELTMEGSFIARTTLSAGTFCPLEIETSSFPCETRVNWTALRLSGVR